MVGTFDLMRKVGMISKSEATTTASVVRTVKSTGSPSQRAVPPAWANRRQRPGGRGASTRRIASGAPDTGSS